MSIRMPILPSEGEADGEDDVAKDEDVPPRKSLIEGTVSNPKVNFLLGVELGIVSGIRGEVLGDEVKGYEFACLG